MADARRVEDRLRAEYAALLPAMKRILVSLETEIRYLLLPLILELDRHEQIVVRARLKGCESAVDSLRRRQNGGVFEPDRAELYSLTALPDLVALRVMTFPRRRFDCSDSKRSSIGKSASPDLQLLPLARCRHKLLPPTGCGPCRSLCRAQ